MKRTIKQIIETVFLAILVLLCLVLPISAEAETVASGSCGENVTWQFDETTGVLLINGKGNMEDFTEVIEGVHTAGKAPWYNLVNQITEVKISSDVTSIGSYAFYDCTKIEDIKLPEKLKSIGVNSFGRCSGLSGELRLPDKITGISLFAFNGCTGITSVVLSEQIETLMCNIFRDCTGI